MRKFLVLLVALLVSATVLPGCGRGGVPAGWKPYQNSEYQFRLNYPKDWQIQTPAGTAVAFVSPGADDFSENLCVVVEQCGDITLEQYVAAGKAHVLESMPGVSISSEKTVVVQGREGHEWIIKWLKDSTPLKQRQVLFVASGKAYVLTFSAMESTYDAYTSTFEQMGSSFTLA